jgi:hypothetical protein
MRGKKFGGRTRGTVNRVTVEIRDLARQYGPAALAEIVHILRNSCSEKARLAAAEILLDRGYGRVAAAPAGPATNVQVNVGVPPGRTLSPQEAYRLMIETTSPDDTRAIIERIERPALRQEAVDAETVLDTPVARPEGADEGGE